MNRRTKNNSAENELNAIRISLYEQTKDMTSDEQIEFFRTMVKEGFAKHGIRPQYAETSLVRR